MIGKVIENRRKLVGLSREALSSVMGIDRNQYGNRLKSNKGFHEVEVLRAMPVLGLKLLIVEESCIREVDAEVSAPRESKVDKAKRMESNRRMFQESMKNGVSLAPIKLFGL